MADDQWLTDRFEEQRTHLQAVAYRMLGSASDADDAVQEAWIRLSRSDSSAVENLGVGSPRLWPGSHSTCCVRVRRGVRTQ